MARGTFRVEGLRELDRALGELPKATARNTLQRALTKAAQPIAEAARAKAPVLTGETRQEIGIGTRLTKRQKALHRRMTRGAGKAFAEVFVGATGGPDGAVPQSTQREFGTDGAPPHPYMRPAWDGNKMGVLNRIRTELASEIEKTAQRAARKAARRARAR